MLMNSISVVSMISIIVLAIVSEEPEYYFK